jgi:hypothetical protein
MCFHCLSPPKSRRSFKVTYIDKECCHQVWRVHRRSWISASGSGAPTLREVNTKAKLGTTESREAEFDPREWESERRCRLKRRLNFERVDNNFSPIQSCRASHSMWE